MLQLRDYTLYDTFTQAIVVLAHLFIALFVLIIILQVYQVIFFSKYNTLRYHKTLKRPPRSSLKINKHNS